MLKTILFIAAFISIAAAGWVHTYGGTGEDVLTDGVLLLDGDFIVTGYSDSSDSTYNDYWAMKINADGDVIWQNYYGGIYDDKAYAVCDVEDGFIIVGSTNSFGAGTPGYSNIYIVKIDGDGEILWESTYESDLDDCAYDIIQYGGECIVAGYTWLDFSTRDEGILLFVSTDSGTIDSTLVTSGASSDGFRAISAISGEYTAAGYTKSFGTGTPSYSNVYIMKSTGEQFSLGGENIDEAAAIICDDSGNFIVAGKTASIGAGGTDLYLLKADSSGDILWQSAFGGAMYDFGEDIVVMDDGIVAIGFTNSFGAGYDDLYLVKTDLDGDSLWQKTYGGMQNDNGNAIISCDDDGFLLVGATMSFGEGNFDGYLLRVNSEGDTVGDGIKSQIRPSDIEISVSPNPFNSSCEIAISTPSMSPPYQGGDVPDLSGTEGVNIAIYDLRGNVVATPSLVLPLNKGEMSEGQRGFIWTPDKSISSGIYFVKARTEGSQAIVKRIIYLK